MGRKKSNQTNKQKFEFVVALLTLKGGIGECDNSTTLYRDRFSAHVLYTYHREPIKTEKKTAHILVQICMHMSFCVYGNYAPVVR